MKKARKGRFISLMNRSILTNTETCIQFLKFSLIGLANTGLQYIVFLVLYRLFGVYYLAASAIGYCVGMVNSFVLNKFWTFQSLKSRSGIEFMKFTMVNGVALLINLGVLEILVSGFRIRPEHGQVVAIGFSTVANFFGNKLWTFRKRPVPISK